MTRCGARVLYGDFISPYMGVTVRLVNVRGGYGLLKKFFFMGQNPPWNVHLLTGEPFDCAVLCSGRQKGRFSAYKHRKVSLSEGCNLLVYIFCYFIRLAVNVGRGQCSLSERCTSLFLGLPLRAQKSLL